MHRSQSEKLCICRYTPAIHRTRSHIFVMGYGHRSVLYARQEAIQPQKYAYLLQRFPSSSQRLHVYRGMHLVIT